MGECTNGFGNAPYRGDNRSGSAPTRTRVPACRVPGIGPIYVRKGLRRIFILTDKNTFSLGPEKDIDNSD